MAKVTEIIAKGKNIRDIKNPQPVPSDPGDKKLPPIRNNIIRIRHNDKITEQITDKALAHSRNPNIKILLKQYIIPKIKIENRANI